MRDAKKNDQAMHNSYLFSHCSDSIVILKFKKCTSSKQSPIITFNVWVAQKIETGSTRRSALVTTSVAAVLVFRTEDIPTSFALEIRITRLVRFRCHTCSTADVAT